MEDRTTGSRYFRSELGSHHITGHGCVEDDYSETSGSKGQKRYWKKWEKPRFPSDRRDPNSLNGPVIIVQKGKVKEDGK